MWSPSKRSTCHGQLFGVASIPPTILRPSSFGLTAGAPQTKAGALKTASNSVNYQNSIIEFQLFTFSCSDSCRCSGCRNCSGRWKNGWFISWRSDNARIKVVNFHVKVGFTSDYQQKPFAVECCVIELFSNEEPAKAVDKIVSIDNFNVAAFSALDLNLTKLYLSYLSGQNRIFNKFYKYIYFD